MSSGLGLEVVDTRFGILLRNAVSKFIIKGLADIVLFGNMEDMVDHHHVGTKYLWVSSGGVLEMHGRQKLPWTHLTEHIFRNSSVIK